MNELEDSFAKLLGRRPTDSESQQLYRIRDALGLKNNDALWLVLMALQYHQTLYDNHPERIKRAAADTLLHFLETANSVLVATKELVRADLANAVSAAAHDVARLTTVKQATTWITASLLSCCLAFGAFGWYIHRDASDAGFTKGYSQAYNVAKDEKAAAAWANTPQGRAAY